MYLPGKPQVLDKKPGIYLYREFKNEIPHYYALVIHLDRSIEDVDLNKKPVYCRNHGIWYKINSLVKDISANLIKAMLYLKLYHHFLNISLLMRIKRSLIGKDNNANITPC